MENYAEMYPIKTIESQPKKALVLSRITDSFKGQYFMSFEKGKQIQHAVKNVKSNILHTAFT